MKQLLPKLKKNNCKKLISKKKSQIDRVMLTISEMLCFQFLKYELLSVFYNTIGQGVVVEHRGVTGRALAKHALGPGSSPDQGKHFWPFLGF